MEWLIVAMGAYFFLALASVFDKFLLGKRIADPRVYAFLVSIFGGLAFLLAPLGLQMPTPRLLFASLLIGLSFVVALVLLYASIKRSELSRVIPVVGALQAMIISLLSWLMLGERLGMMQFAAFALLVAGGALMSYRRAASRSKDDRPWMLLAVGSSVSFALFFVLTKYVFLSEPFINGFLWPRAGVVAAALPLLAFRNVRHSIRACCKKRKSGKASKRRHRATAVLFASGQLSGAVGFLGVNYAISLASVSLVNALQGAQYAFVFLLSLAASIVLPKAFREHFDTWTIVQKIVALGLITGGIVLLFLA